jgi:putative transposase
MTQHLHLPLPGATYYFTVRLEQRGSTALTDHVDALRYAYARAVAEFPVTCHAMVVLPDHLHAIWTEPAGEVWYSERWRRIKTRFTHAVAAPAPLRPGLDAGREPALWQRRFAEHAIRTEDEYRRAMEHCRTNPVRHGLVSSPEAWPYSSFAKARGLPVPPVTRARADLADARA